MPSLRGCLVAAALLPLVWGCVTMAEHRALEREVALLKRGGVPEGGAEGGGAFAPDAARLAELGAQLEELEREVASLRGATDETRKLAETALQQVHTLRDEQPTPAAPRDATGATGATGATPQSPESLEGPPLGAEAAREVRAYEEAFRYFRIGDYRTAIDRFGTFLQNYPSSEYADNALFWMGECNFRLGDHERAVLTFEDVTRRFPDGNKVPDALFRQGIALLEIGKRKEQQKTYEPAAREIFQRILRDYPDSDRAPEARRQLEKLGS